MRFFLVYHNLLQNSTIRYFYITICRIMSISIAILILWNEVYTMVEFAEELRQLRREHGLTQAELASMIGVKNSVISFYEMGDRVPSPKIIKKLAATLHVSADYLLGIENHPSIDVSGLDESDIALVRSLVDTLRYKNARN